MASISYISLLIVIFVNPAISAPQHLLRVLCYIPSWGIFIEGDKKFDVADIEPALEKCTHLVYMYGRLNGDTFQVESQDPYWDFELGGLRQIAALKAKFPHLKTMLSVGGWEDGSLNYSRMAAQPQHRKAFVDSCQKYVLENGFDGMELDWQYPGERGGTTADKENVVELVRQLRQLFDGHGLLVSMAVGGLPFRIHAGVNGKELTKHVHFFNVRTYQYHGAWDGKVGVGSPLTASDGISISKTIERYIDMGVPKNKINLGLASMGMVFKVEKESKGKSVMGAPAVEAMDIGSIIDYNVFCKKKELEKGWQELWDKETKTPYSLKEDIVVSHDNNRSIALKIKFAIDNKLGGFTYDGLWRDDFKNFCSSSLSKYPFLRWIDESIVHYGDMATTEIIKKLSVNKAYVFWSNVGLNQST